LLPRAIDVPILSRAASSLPKLGSIGSIEEAEQVQQNNDEDGHTREPQDDIAQHVDNLL